MKCNDARKFLYAFADGQLSVRANCEVLDHLKMCPACSRLVDEHQALRAAIGRDIAALPVPQGLRASVREALSAEAGGASTPARRPRPAAAIDTAPPANHGRIRDFLRSRVMLAAASLAIVAAGAWWVWPSGPAAKVDSPRTAVADGRAAAEKVSQIHLSHAALGRTHQGADLPASLGEAAEAIASRLGARTGVSPPNLSEFGFDFESANLCKVCDGEEELSGHIIYAERHGRRRLSFFVAPRFDGIDASVGAAAGKPYREYELGLPGEVGVSLLTWRDGNMAVICCGDVDMGQMKLWVGAIRTAMADFDGQLRRAWDEMREEAGRCEHSAS